MDSFTIEDAATSIGEYAFWDCQKLETLSLGKNITTIGDDAFRSCYKLETIMLPAGLASFGNCLIGCPAGRKWDYHGKPINPLVPSTTKTTGTTQKSFQAIIYLKIAIFFTSAR